MNNYKPNEYEIEFKIANKLKFFKNIQQFLHVERFEKTKIYYFKNERVIEDLVTNKFRYEKKKTIMKKVFKLDFYPYEIQLKISKETTLSEKIDIKNSNTSCYRYRLIFSKNDFPFEIDLSLRVFPNNKNNKLPEFTDEDLFNPIYNSSHDYYMIYDLEFEILPDYKGSNEDAFNQLKDLLKMTSEEYSGKIQNIEKYENINEDINIENENINEYKHKDIENKNINKNENKQIGSDIDELISEIINKTFNFVKTPQVSVLTNKVLDIIDLSNFVYLEKTDGLRTLLIYYDNNLYTYRAKEGLIKIQNPFKTKNENIFIVDSEFFKDKYYVFDVYYVNKDIRTLGFIERMKIFDSFIKTNEIIITKDYKEVNSIPLKDLIKYGMTKRPNVDGIVLQSKEGYDLNIWLKKEYQYKLKPLELTTTDFLYKWIDSEKCYYLYLIGSFGELVFNLKARPRCLQKAYEPFKINLKNMPKQNSYLILFDTPLFDNMYKCNVGINELKNIEGFDSSKQLKNIEGCLDGLIIETSYFASEDRKYQQTPIRIRHDKVNPNGYKIGLANACILFSPPTSENHYFNKITNEEVEHNFKLNNGEGELLIDTFHQFNQKIRDYTFKKLKDVIDENESISKNESINKYKTAFDLCGGRGSDLKRLYSLGFNNIIAADADAEALVTYSLKAIFYKAWNNIDSKNIGKLTLNCLCEPLGNNGKEMKLILDMEKRYEFKKSDLIVIDYALHYICNEKYENNLTNLIKIIKTVSHPGSFVLINFYDGDKIIKYKGNFEIFKIKIEPEINGMIKAYMPLPTIEKDGYREEPLILNKHIQFLQNNGLSIINDYYPVLEEEFKEMKTNSDFENKIMDYLSCIRSIIMKV